MAREPFNSSASSELSRRELLRLLGLAGGVASIPLLSSCGRRSAEVLARTEVLDLNFWGTGTLDIEDKWNRLLERQGIRVNFEDNGNDPGPVIKRLCEDKEFASRHVSGVQGGAERELAACGAIEPWDLNLIPNYEKLWPWAQQIEYTKVEGEVFGLPSVVNADSMIFLPERVGEIDSYAAVFDPDLRGKTSMEDAWINSVIFTAIYLKENKLESIENPGNLTPSELREVMRFLTEKAQEGQFKKLWKGWTDGVSLIASEDVWVMTGWEPIVYEARRQGVNAKYAVPKEGYEGWSNDLLLHPGARTAGVYDAAHDLVNWELSGFYGCVLAELRGYVVPTDEAITYAELHPEDFQPEKIREIVENVKKKFFAMKGQVYWQNVRPDEYQLYEEEWAKFRELV